MGEGQGPHLHEQDLVRTIRDTGERERGAHRDTEGGWAGFTHTTGSQGFPSRIGQSCTRRHGGRRGPPTGCALLVLLLLTRDSDRFAARWTPYSTGDLSRLATFLQLLTGSLSYHGHTDRDGQGSRRGWKKSKMTMGLTCGLCVVALYVRVFIVRPMACSASTPRLEWSVSVRPRSVLTLNKV